MKKFFTDKVKNLFDNFLIVKNKARQNCLYQATLGLICARNVQLPAVAEKMKMEGNAIKVKSIHHRLEDFFREVAWDYEQLALLLILFLGEKGKLRLCIDRTEWDFGTYQVNILMIIACKEQKHIPLYWELLDNHSGNSSSQNRIDLLQKAIDLIGVASIGIVVADREFIGHDWFKFLKDKHIHFCIRVPKHHLIERFDGRIQSAESLASSQPLYLKDCLIDGVWVNVYLKKLADGDLLFLAGTMSDPKHLGQVYRKRWTIETMFQSFKKRGFAIEDTHFKCNDKLKKMVGLVSIAFSVCMNIGVYVDRKIAKIKEKKHGYKAHSFCRTGIDWLKDILKQSVQEFEYFAHKLIRFLIVQKLKFFKNKLKYTLSSS
jgi:Transposase DDE domain